LPDYRWCALWDDPSMASTRECTTHRRIGLRSLLTTISSAGPVDGAIVKHRASGEDFSPRLCERGRARTCASWRPATRADWFEW